MKPTDRQHANRQHADRQTFRQAGIQKGNKQAERGAIGDFTAQFTVQQDGYIAFQFRPNGLFQDALYLPQISVIVIFKNFFHC
jgi:hypothetical protein